MVRWLNELIERIKKLLTSPQSFFSSLKKEKGLETSFKYFAVLSIIPAVFSLTIGRVWGNYSINAVNQYLNLQIPLPQFTFEFFFSNAVLMYIISLGLSFVWAGILHVWILLFDGKETYEKTYQLSVYSQTPRLLLGWVPVLGALVWIYDLYLLVIGTEKIHGIPQKKALLIYLIPAIVFFVLALIGIIFSMLFFTTLSAGMMQDLASNLVI